MRGVSAEILVCEGGRSDYDGGTGSSVASKAKNVSTNRVGRKWSQMCTKSEYVMWKSIVIATRTAQDELSTWMNLGEIMS